jgi:RHS repeat-associated protein
VTVTGSAGGPWTVTFAGTHNGLNVPRMDGDAARLTSGTSIRTIEYVYDAASQITSASDPDSSYAYTYDNLGRVTKVDNNGTANTPRVELSATYDAHGNRTSLAAKLAGTDDFKTNYTFDALHRMTRIEQTGQSGGNTVAEKRIDLAYNAAGLFTEIVRYKDTDGGSANEVATAGYSYDALGRITGLSYKKGGNNLFTAYAWTYDRMNRVTQLSGQDGTSDYSYDSTSQLTATDHSFQTDESYTYDANGNRTMTGYTTGTNNRLTNDGTHSYQYDDEGNRKTRTKTSTGEKTEYTWDHRNRLTSVIEKNSSGDIVKQTDYTYDVYDRRLSKSIDADGAGPGAATVQRFVYYGHHIVMEFDGNNAGDLTHRYLHGPVIDQILADEEVTSLTQAGTMRWPLADNLGTVRDLVDSSATVLNHLKYDAYGKVTSESNAAVDFLFAFTGRERDEETGLQFNRARYYDPAVGRWISEDPIGFAAGDANLIRYVNNAPGNSSDPFGLQEQPLTPRSEPPKIEIIAPLEINDPTNPATIDLFIENFQNSILASQAEWQEAIENAAWDQTATDLTDDVIISGMQQSLFSAGWNALDPSLTISTQQMQDWINEVIGEDNQDLVFGGLFGAALAYYFTDPLGETGREELEQEIRDLPFGNSVADALSDLDLQILLEAAGIQTSQSYFDGVLSTNQEWSYNVFENQITVEFGASANMQNWIRPTEGVFVGPYVQGTVIFPGGERPQFRLDPTETGVGIKIEINR